VEAFSFGKEYDDDMDHRDNISFIAQRLRVPALVLMTGLAVAPVTFTQEKAPMNETPTFIEDGAKRYADIHWPAGFHPDQADLFAHNEIVVKASCKTVWGHIIEAEKWPSWYPNSHNVKLLNSIDGKLHADTQFSWDTFGVHIESRIHEFIANSRIGWFGDGTGMNAYHTFLLLKVYGGCHLITEEVVKGPGAVEFRQKHPNAMFDGHNLWLKTLKDLSEKNPRP
jgi:hypothetical protein